MNKVYLDNITEQLSVEKWQVENGIDLLKEGATIPFISRYRKEKTGELDEVQLGDIERLFKMFEELEKRKETIKATIEEQEKMTPQLLKEIEECVDPNRLEDLYLPYRPKRRTRATIAKERGLEPLAELLLTFKLEEPYSDAESYLSDEVESVEEALAGASDIIAESVNENGEVREGLRKAYLKHGVIVTKEQRGLSEEMRERSKFINYFDLVAKVDNIPSHRLLAILRGVNEGELTAKIELEERRVLNFIKSIVYGEEGRSTPLRSREVIDGAIEDSYKRLLHPSLENETFRTAKEIADREAVRVFGVNLTELLLAPPLGEKRVLAIDPGFRTGCKVVCLDAQGELLHNDTIYPHPPTNDKIGSIKKLSNLIESYKIEVIAIGNGTASRETEALIKKVAMPEGVRVYSVSEDGASVYSASAIAREEFPDYDVTVRGAVSIGRRAMDPLAELVKIDPKSLGIGQYQHDVDPKMLKERLDSVVISSVNKVGVNLNTASRHLLSYVSGVGPAVAKNIVDYRAANGPFSSKEELLKVSRLGPKIFEQSAGFLRIPNGENPLDNTAVHPERYSLVEQMAKDVGATTLELIKESAVRESVKIENYLSEEVGKPTLVDIMEELARPGRDPRGRVKVLEFSDEIYNIEDLKEGMILPGIVTNITKFGAFVNIGIKEDGLVHISQLADRFVKDPTDVVKLHQHVKVRVLAVDLTRGRIQLSMKGVE